MTLPLPSFPARISPTVITALADGGMTTDMISWIPALMAQRVLIELMVVWGIAPCPPLPETSMRYQSAEA